jgi:multiple sugar transport system ATP-binding protein
MQKDLGITTIYVTHDQVEAMTMADRIAVMNNGRLQQYATPSDLYNRPANTFVAGFIGSVPMNIVDGSVDWSDGRAVIDLGPIRVRLLDDQSSVLRSLGASGEVLIGIRPEHVRVGEGEYEGEVYIIEPSGKDKIIHVRVGELIIRAIVGGDVEVREGSKIRFSFQVDKIHVFDRKSGDAYF